MRWSRRDFLSSLSATALIAKAAQADASCFVTRSSVGDFPSKSYTCDLAKGKELTVTFMRLSDLMFDVARSRGPVDFLPQSIVGMRILGSDALNYLEALFSRFSQRIEYLRPGYNYVNAFGDENYGSTLGGEGSIHYPARTLGVWNSAMSAPTFPLPNELRARDWVGPTGEGRVEFIRFANRSDFRDLSENFKEYIIVLHERLLRERFEVQYTEAQMMDWLSVGNLQMLHYMDAGSVPTFVPIFAVIEGGCGALDGIGILYDPPALFVDIAVFENTGSAPFVLDDVLGEVDTRSELRPYSHSVARRQDRLGLDPAPLQAGESALMVQRLLFRPLKEHFPDVGSTETIFGSTQLPTGAVVDGENVYFEGRSHNSLILVSSLPATCCPFIEYWCSEAMEWVSLGNILGEAEGEDKKSSDDIHLYGFADSFRIIEQEAEFTMISDVFLEILEANGNKTVIPPENLRKLGDDSRPIRIDYLEQLSVRFVLPNGISPLGIVSSKLRVTGYYEKYMKGLPTDT